MNLIELKSELENLKKEANRLYVAEDTKLHDKVELYFNTLFCHLPYHEGLKISASKSDINVKVLGWGLSDVWSSPIEFEFRSWDFDKEDFNILPLTKLRTARIDFDNADLKNEELIKKYSSFMSVVGSYTDTLFAHKVEIETKMADFSKETDYTSYYEITSKVYDLEKQITAEEARLKQEEISKVSAITEFLFEEPLREFYHGGENFDYIGNVTRIKVIKKNKTKTNLEIWYRDSHSYKVEENFEYASCDSKFWKDEIYTKYFDKFIAENLNKLNVN